MEQGKNLAFVALHDVLHIKVRHVPASKNLAPIEDSFGSLEGLVQHGGGLHGVTEVHDAVLRPELLNRLERGILGTVVHPRAPRLHVAPKSLKVLGEILIGHGSLGKRNHLSDDRLVLGDERVLVHERSAVVELEVSALSFLVEPDAVNELAREGHLLARRNVQGGGGPGGPAFTLGTLIDAQHGVIGHGPSLLQEGTPLEATLPAFVDLESARVFGVVAGVRHTVLRHELLGDFLGVGVGSVESTGAPSAENLAEQNLVALENLVVGFLLEFAHVVHLGGVPGLVPAHDLVVGVVGEEGGELVHAFSTRDFITVGVGVDRVENHLNAHGVVVDGSDNVLDGLVLDGIEHLFRDTHHFTEAAILVVSLARTHDEIELLGEETRELGGEFSKHAGVGDADSDFRLEGHGLLGELEVDILGAHLVVVLS